MYGIKLKNRGKEEEVKWTAGRMKIFFEYIQFSCIKCQAITFAGTIIRFRRFSHSLHLSHPSDLNIVFRDFVIFLQPSFYYYSSVALLLWLLMMLLLLYTMQQRQWYSQSVSVCAIHTHFSCVFFFFFSCVSMFLFFSFLAPWKSFPWHIYSFTCDGLTFHSTHLV